MRSLHKGGKGGVPFQSSPSSPLLTSHSFRKLETSLQYGYVFQNFTQYIMLLLRHADT